MHRGALGALNPVHGTTLEDLDLNLFKQEYLPSAVTPEVLRENGRSLAEQLAALHLASPDAVPNVTGLLILGREATRAPTSMSARRPGRPPIVAARLRGPLPGPGLELSPTPPASPPPSSSSCATR
ncbi:hypothetical protein [Nannocystis sp.]|uniref:hypothetical protein n=1 Tax=Nannocystis sp. TaxID=1962667 RepID=UPI0025D3D40F|nr:hypothetical protein [Nannocystis sp.]MBK7828044.1 hypothetical protein [Nannocystis sp.]